jgi:protein-tyrosine kinase
MNEFGILNEDLKLKIFDNLKELSTIEGNILGAAREREVKTILVTSCNPLEGKTITAISMAFALATKSNYRVILVDGNLQSPKIHELFNVGPFPGLSELLTLKAEIKEVARGTDFGNLVIIPHGSDAYKKLDSFESETFKDKLNYMRQNSDYVIFDAQSVSGTSDVPVISKYFDGIILVVECEKTRWEVLQQAKEKIISIGGNILGVVLNKRIYYIPVKLYGKI